MEARWAATARGWFSAVQACPSGHAFGQRGLAQSWSCSRFRTTAEIDEQHVAVVALVNNQLGVPV